MSFLISESLKDKIDLDTLTKEDMHDGLTNYELFELTVSDNKVYLSLYSNNFVIKNYYMIKKVNSNFKSLYFKENMKFKFKSIKNYNNKTVLTIFIDEKLFWENIEDEEYSN
jgi:hypothetical protein